jgi:hypothetical protein
VSEVQFPPGHLRKLAIASRAKDLGEAIHFLRSAVRGENWECESEREPYDELVHWLQAVWKEHTVCKEDKLQAGNALVAKLADLRSLTQAVLKNEDDPDGGRRATPKTVKAALGVLTMETIAVQQAAGLEPSMQPAVATPVAGEQAAIASMRAALESARALLAPLERAAAEPAKLEKFEAQGDVVKFYVGAVRVEIDQARLQLRLGETVIDLAALENAAEAIRGMTHDFVATISAWAELVSPPLKTAVQEVDEGTTKAVKAVKSFVRRVWSRSGMSGPAPFHDEPPDEPPPPPPPADFDLAHVHACILAGMAPPAAWVPRIVHLDFEGTRLKYLQYLKELTALQQLNLGHTEVRDIVPLAGLTALQDLSLRRTGVSYFIPLAGLTALRSLNLVGTDLRDVEPFAGLTALQTLQLAGTQIRDIRPLAGLTGLQNLNLGGTQVRNIEPLAGLTGLQHLYLGSTLVVDVAPLARIAGLRVVLPDGSVRQF